MKSRDIRRSWFWCLLAIASALALSTVNGLATEAREDSALALQTPSFVGNEMKTGAPSFLETEAGISAYAKASTPIDLNDVRGLYRTIEVEETPTHIIGSIPVPYYGEEWDAHVYIHADGWILAYYLAADPVAKIFDWRVYHDAGRTKISTKLDNTIAWIAAEAGISVSDVAYYDFRYPKATHLMLIVEWVCGGTDSFQVKLPEGFAYYERSWSLGTEGGGEAHYKLNGVTMQSFCRGWQISQGTLTAARLSSDQFHTIEVTNQGSFNCSGSGCAYGGLALVYRMEQ